MSIHFHSRAMRRFASLLGLVSMMALSHGVVLRNYSAVLNDRFINFSLSPAVNPTSLYAAVDLSGVGWFLPNPDIQFTLVSRQHLVFASHFSPAIGNNPIRFLSASGELITRKLVSRTVVDDGGNPSDLILMTLDAPIDEFEQVRPLPYLNLASGGDYAGLSLGVLGKRLREGKSEIALVEAAPRTEEGLNPTRFLRFDYSSFFGDASDAYVEIGDSGSPSFVLSGGRAALVGTHSYVEQINPFSIQNFDVFVPHYVAALDLLMEPLGYRMRPVNTAATSLSGEVTVTEPVPRRGKPLNLDFTVSNSGPAVTGNLELELSFEQGEAPDSVSGSGWVVYGAGTRWTLRKARMAAAESGVVTASWAQAPSQESISPRMVWRSDSEADQVVTTEIVLAPSYADWASALSEGGPRDDPDWDRLLNLQEYALGGDAEDWRPELPNGAPLLPVISADGSQVTYCFPERIDKDVRGLSYVLWFARGLADDSWTLEPPAGMSSVTMPYDPAVVGFVKRCVSWPLVTDYEFVRLQILLEE